jgi:hypothetical protein
VIRWSTRTKTGAIRRTTTSPFFTTALSSVGPIVTFTVFESHGNRLGLKARMLTVPPEPK